MQVDSRSYILMKKLPTGAFFLGVKADLWGIVDAVKGFISKLLEMGSVQNIVYYEKGRGIQDMGGKGLA